MLINIVMMTGKLSSPSIKINVLRMSTWPFPILTQLVKTLTTISSLTVSIVQILLTKSSIKAALALAFQWHNASWAFSTVKLKLAIRTAWSVFTLHYGVKKDWQMPIFFSLLVSKCDQLRDDGSYAKWCQHGCVSAKCSRLSLANQLHPKLFVPS